MFSSKTQNKKLEIDGRNIYDQPINDTIKQYDEVRKISTGQSDDYTTRCLLDFNYFEKNYRLIAAYLSKQKALMLIQEKFNKLFLLAKHIIKLEFIKFLNNQKKQYQIFQKEQQKFIK